MLLNSEVKSVTISRKEVFLTLENGIKISVSNIGNHNKDYVIDIVDSFMTLIDSKIIIKKDLK